MVISRLGKVPNGLKKSWKIINIHMFIHEVHILYVLDFSLFKYDMFSLFHVYT